MDVTLAFLGFGITLGMMLVLVVAAILAIPITLIFLHGVYEVIIAPIVKGAIIGWKEGQAKFNQSPQTPSE